MSDYVLYTAPIVSRKKSIPSLPLILKNTARRYAGQLGAAGDTRCTDTFHTRFPNERRWIKILVYTVFPLELAQTGVSSHYAYWVLALGWGNTTALEILPWSCLATPIFTGITAALVQIFFAWRIYLLMHNLKTVWACVVTAVIVLLALTQAVIIFFVVAQFAHATAFTNVMRIKVGVKSWLIVAAICDVFITTTLIIIFFQYRMQMPSEERRTDTFIGKLMLTTVETGAVTSVTALIYLVVFLLYPEYNIEETPTFILGKLYANVLLFTLNVRRFWPNRMNEAQHGVGTFTSVYATYATHSASDCIELT